MALNKAPSLDGFPIDFFQWYWGIMGDDIIVAIQEFQIFGRMLKAWNATFIALVPKVDVTKEFKQFRPINLGSVIYKILIKAMANRIKHLLPMIISQEQEGFISGHQIVGGIIEMHEIIHLAHWEEDATFLLKLDM